MTSEYRRKISIRFFKTENSYESTIRIFDDATRSIRSRAPDCDFWIFVRNVYLDFEIIESLIYCQIDLWSFLTKLQLVAIPQKFFDLRYVVVTTRQRILVDKIPHEFQHRQNLRKTKFQCKRIVNSNFPEVKKKNHLSFSEYFFALLFAYVRQSGQ